MSDPTTPNFTKNIGRLVTDRFDFEDHIEGNNFRHKANQIDLFPTLVIGGGTKTNVQDALATLTTLIAPPVIPDATPFVKGLIQLVGDIGGAATHVIVTGLQQHPISTLSPNNGDVLTWNSGSGSWTPTPSAASSFVAGGDLSGTNLVQRVISITGSAGTVQMLCGNINFADGLVPVINQVASTTSNGATWIIAGQDTTGSNRRGGAILISGGKGNGTGGQGTVALQIFNVASNSKISMVQLAEPIGGSGNHVLSLLYPTNITNVDMPANTGDMVMYVRDTPTPPTTGVPSGGTILYSSGGQLFVKQSNADQFSVGSLSNPSIWGPAGQQTYTSRSYVNTVSSTQATAFDFLPPINTAIQVEAVVVGKRIGATDSQQYRMIMGFSVDGTGNIFSVGTLNSIDIRQLGSWIATPQIIASGGHIQVKTGSAPGTAEWFTTTKLSMSTA